jgi:outer membrane lipoprotein-sorting protein
MELPRSKERSGRGRERGGRRGRGPAAVLCVSLLGLCFLASLAHGQTPTGLEIMTWVDERDDGDNGVTDMQMILIDKNDKQRIREIRSFSKDFGEDDYSIMFFLSPADVKDVGFLSYDYDDSDKDDDQWLYLPALGKVKRIASADKSGSFMGSDFSYSDMSSRELENYDYKLLQETDVDGVPVWVVESIPKTEEEIDETGYTKSVVFVRKDNNVMIRAKNWVKKGKRLKFFDVKKLEQIDGIWVPTELTMTTKKGKATIHKTVIKMSNVRFNQNLSDDLFTTRQLEKGL